MVSTAKQSHRILIVEDDTSLEPLWCDIVHYADPLSQYTWCVSIAEAEEQIDGMYAHSKMFDAIVSDIFVSGSKTGIDLSERYKQLISDRFILVTSSNCERLSGLIENLSIGKIHVLQKPFKFLEAVIKLRAILYKTNPDESNL